MYSLRFTFLPIYGKAPDARAALEERARAFNAEGQRATVSMPIAGPDIGAIYTGLQFETMAAYQDYRDNVPPARAAASQVMQSKLQNLLREPTRIELNETLLMAQNMAWTPKYISRVSRVPAPGKAQELRQCGLEFARAAQERGLRVGFQVEAAGGAAGTCVQNNVWQSLDDFESNRTRNRGDASIQKALQELNALCAAPPTLSLAEITVPLPPRP